MKYLQKLGKAIMLPVACMPLCGLLMGIGYLLCPASMQGSEIAGFFPTIGLFLVKAGGALIDHIAVLFAVGIGVGMAEERDGTAGLASLVSWFMMTTLLRPEFVSQLIPSVAQKESMVLAFQKSENPFIGILAGLIGAQCYNRFKDTSLPDWLGFFSGKRSTVIMSGAVSVAASVVLMLVWPVLFGIFVKIGQGIAGMGAFGAGVYAFLNRLLLPFGLHHALNNVFWFDTIGLGDLSHFWAGETSADVSWPLGIYMSGFFPCMMFGVPGAALAMIRCAKDEKKKKTAGILFSAALCSFVCGITEPFEFAFMFAAPWLYIIYALLYGLFAYVTALTGFRAGFSFSAGATDLIFSASLPAAQKTLLILPLGIAAFAVYYFTFRTIIEKYDLKTPGREDNDTDDGIAGMSGGETVAGVDLGALLRGLGGKDNIVSLDHCVTRLRIDVEDLAAVDENEIKSAGAKGVMKVGKKSLQVIIGLSVQKVFDALSRRMKSRENAEARPACVISCANGRVLQPVSGRVIAMEDIPDETFATGVLGQGVGIEPDDNKVTAPFDGVVTMIADSGHAVGLESDGMEVLIHVGVDTVTMKGDGFECLVNDGDTVKAGQTLIIFDREKITGAGLSDTVAVLLTNSDDIENVECGVSE